MKRISLNRKGKAWVTTLCLLLFSPISLASGEDNIVLPSFEITSYCEQAGCDNQLFYRFYESKKARFCRDARIFLSSKKHIDVLGYLIEASTSKGLPGSFSVVPVIESSLRVDVPASEHPNAAKGLWQFKPSTARDMGLIVSDELDERLDMVRSTEAGLKYLVWLANRFDGDVNLAILAYHAGVGRVERVSKKYNTKNAWYISSLISAKHPDRNYLPKFYSYTLALTNKGC